MHAIFSIKILLLYIEMISLMYVQLLYCIWNEDFSSFSFTFTYNTATVEF